MEIKGEAKLLRIFISTTDKFKHTPLYEVIVFTAKRYGIAGATVLKGSMGFGSSSTIHSLKFWEVTEKLPVVVEIIDEAEKIEKYIEKILYGCIITVENATIILNKQGIKKGSL